MQNTFVPRIGSTQFSRAITVFELNTACEAENLARVHPICNEWPCTQLELPSVFQHEPHRYQLWQRKAGSLGPTNHGLLGVIMRLESEDQLCVSLGFDSSQLFILQNRDYLALTS